MEFPQEFYSQYIERRKHDLKVLELSLEQGRLEDFKRIGHQLKGNAPSFGFDDLADLAHRMEDLSLEDLYIVGRDVVAAFKKWIESNDHY